MQNQDGRRDLLCLLYWNYSFAYSLTVAHESLELTACQQRSMVVEMRTWQNSQFITVIKEPSPWFNPIIDLLYIVI